MKRRKMSLVVLLLLLPIPVGHAADQSRPNVVVLLADDLGWGDIGVHGGNVPTPNIDRLFGQGVELGNFMTWCVCSPTRAMLLTGRHPFRVGTGPEVGGELEAGETTVAEGFKANGYQTGVFGKWHNGEDPDTPEFRKAFLEAFKSQPGKRPEGGLGANAHGFDEAWVYYGGGADYFNRRTVAGRGPVSWWHKREFRPQDTGYTEDLITEHAREFIRENKGQPFFCYVPFHLIHAPMQAKPEDEARVAPGFKDQKEQTRKAMILALDSNVGALLSEIDAQGIASNTIVVFTSDNGGTPDGNNRPFRGSKHTLYDGGVHAPAVVRWPAGGLSGGKKWNGLCGALDLFPTLIDLAGGTMPATRPLDGRSIAAALRGGSASPVESYYWAWHDSDALRTDRWKLHRYSDRTELYDMHADQGESRDLSQSQPEVVTAMTAKLDEWAGSLGAALSHRPTPRRLDAAPAPEGDVLEITVTQTKPVARLSDALVVPVATLNRRHFATDVVEYDVCVAPDSLTNAFYYTPFKGRDQATRKLTFRRGIGIDQFGREQSQGLPPRGGVGAWEHRVIGLTAGAPTVDPQHGIVFNGKKTGTYHIYLDNLRIRHVDGSLTPIWSSSKDTSRASLANTLPAFEGLKVRAVPLPSFAANPQSQTPTPSPPR